MRPKLSLLERLEARFRLIEEAGPDLSWKSYESLRQQQKAKDPGPAYHALMATAGPCTGNAVWTRDWKSPDGFVFRKGTPAPHWSHADVQMAMEPQIRIWARAEARKSGGQGHGARQDPNAIDDMAGNMQTILQQILDREKDQGRILGGEQGNGFVSYVARTVSMGGAKGAGGTDEMRVARGRASQLAGPKFFAKWDSPPGNQGHIKTAEQARAIADRVAPEFRQATRKSFDGTPIGSSKFDPGNPYERFSPNIYSLANQLADAIDSGDREAIERAHDDADTLYRRIEDAEENTQGTHNAKRIITTPSGAVTDKAKAERDRFIKGVKISSMSGARKEDGGDIDIADTSHLRHLSDLDPETVYEVLKMGRTTRAEDLKHPMFAGKGLVPLSDFDLRFLIRQLSNWLPDKKYPGKGVTGKDVEMPDGQPSEWLQNGQPQMWDKNEILSDIGKSSVGGGGGEGGEAGGGLAALLAKISPAQRPYMQLFGQGIVKAEIARQLDKSKVGVGTTIKKACLTLGMTEQEFQDAARSGGASMGSGTTPGATQGGGGEPLTKFSAWMRQYQEEMALDESVDPIDYDIVWKCSRAVTELHHHLVIRPLLEGRIF